MILRLFFFLLSLDDFQAREILAFFFFKSFGDIFYRRGELRNHDIVERVRTLLRFLYRIGERYTLFSISASSAVMCLTCTKLR